MDLRIQGKIALITGAGRGLGQSIAACLAREGVRVLGVSRTESDLQQLVEELPSVAQTHLFFAVDLTSETGPTELFSFLDRHEIWPDIAVHNVGGNLFVADPLCHLGDWRKVMRINVEIPVEINRLLIPKMQRKKWGRICHVSSVSALENQGPPSYCAAKSALVAYTRSVGRYVARDGVIITSILPGAVYTKGGYWDIMTKTNISHVETFLRERMAIQRFGKPEEIGEIVAFLCSDLSSFCVGSGVLADGGQGRVFFNQEIP